MHAMRTIDESRAILERWAAKTGGWYRESEGAVYLSSSGSGWYATMTGWNAAADWALRDCPEIGEKDECGHRFCGSTCAVKHRHTGNETCPLCAGALCMTRCLSESESEQARATLNALTGAGMTEPPTSKYPAYSEDAAARRLVGLRELREHGFFKWFTNADGRGLSLGRAGLCMLG